MSKPRILVARAIFPDIVDRLREHFDVEANPDDLIWTPAELAAQAPTAAQAWLVGAAGASQAAPDVGVGWMFG